MTTINVMISIAVVAVTTLVNDVNSFSLLTQISLPTLTRQHHYSRGNTLVASTVFMSETTEEATLDSSISASTITETTTPTVTDTITDSATETTTTATASDMEMTPEEAASAKRKVQRERYTLFVGNLPFDISEEQIKELFQPYGKVDLINIPRDKVTLKPRGFAFVDMSSEEELEAAIAGADEVMIDNRAIRVMKSLNKERGDVSGNKSPKSDRPKRGDGAPTSGGPPPGTKKIYVGNIPFAVTKEEVGEFFSAYGEVVDVYLPPNAETGTGRGFGFVTMKDEDYLKAIEATDGTEFQGRTLVVNEPLPPGKKAPPRANRLENKTKIYIGNLSFYTVVQTLYDIFGEFGEIIDCYLPEDPSTGASRGFGFVTMATEDALRAIKEIDGCEVDGRVIKVNEAQPKPERDSSRPYGRKTVSDMGEEEVNSWNDMDDQ